MELWFHPVETMSFDYHQHNSPVNVPKHYPSHIFTLFWICIGPVTTILLVYMTIEVKMCLIRKRNVGWHCLVLIFALFVFYMGVNINLYAECGDLGPFKALACL